LKVFHAPDTQLGFALLFGGFCIVLSRHHRSPTVQLLASRLPLGLAAGCVFAVSLLVPPEVLATLPGADFCGPLHYSSLALLTAQTVSVLFAAARELRCSAAALLPTGLCAVALQASELAFLGALLGVEYWMRAPSSLAFI
jgi:hypothetical protein